MIRSMQAAIMKKDLRGLVFNKRLFLPLLIVPFVFTVVIPTIFILIIHFTPEEIGEFQEFLDLFSLSAQAGDMQLLLMGMIFNHIIPVFFMMIPVMAATVMAASSFAGEKEKRTLETLLYCPLTLRQIFESKIFASFILSMLVSFGSFLAMLVVVEAEILLLTGGLLPLNMNWLVTMLLVSPAISLMAITLIVRSSAKAETVEEAQQKAVFMILPILLLVVGQFAGVLLLNAWLLLGLGAVLGLAAGALMKGSIRKLNYESLLKQ